MRLTRRCLLCSRRRQLRRRRRRGYGSRGYGSGADDDTRAIDEIRSRRADADGDDGVTDRAGGADLALVAWLART